MVNWINIFIKKYWAELLVFGAIAGVLFICQSPDITWINTNSDGAHYIYSAKYFYPAHKSSAPLYLLLGHVFLWLPIATEAWRMALISVLSGIGGSFFVYLIVKHYVIEHKNWKWISLASALVYGSSALAISQNIIVETYPLVTTVCLAIFYFALKKRWLISSLMIGIAGAIHPISTMTIIPMLIAFKELRKWKYLVIMSVFVLFYLYIPLTNRAPYMWDAPNGTTGWFGWVKDTFATAQMLSGGLSIWDLPKRVLDTCGQLLLNFVVIGIIPLVIAFWKTKVFKNVLFWLIVIPIVYYVIDLAPQTYVYLQPAIAFAAIAIGIGLSKIGINYAGKIIANKFTKLAVGSIIVVCFIMLVFNCNYFDIGRTLDPNLSAREFYNKELPKVPDGQILLAQQGWEWAMVFPYNKNEGRNIIPVSTGTLASKLYQNQLHEQGVMFDVPSGNITLVALQDYIVKSILESNKNVWITLPTDMSTYGAKIVSAIGNEDKLTFAPLSITDGSMDMQWKWKPSNPYDITTGSIEVSQWVYIIFSNYNVMVFGMMGCIGAVPCWVLWMLIFKKKKWSLKKNHKEIEDVKLKV